MFRGLLFLTATTAHAQRIYAAGSGHDMLGLEATVKEVIALSAKPQPQVLYLGTATYDEDEPREDQTKNFAKLGGNVTALDVAWQTPSSTTMEAAFAAADIVIVSGGNTLFAVDRWRRFDAAKSLRSSLSRSYEQANETIATGITHSARNCTNHHSPSQWSTLVRLRICRARKSPRRTQVIRTNSVYEMLAKLLATKRKMRKRYP